jgi:transcriptional regulator with XRE-family HTH domain
MEHLTFNIRNIREKLGYSQEYMAMKLGIGQNGYSKIELGYTRITVERLFEIAKILNTDVIALLQQSQLKEAV